MKLLSYQEEDVQKICGSWKDRTVYLGSEMGTGKTAIAIECSQRFFATNCLIVCPASVRPVWKGEIEAWIDLEDLDLVDVITTKKDKINQYGYTIVSYDLAAQSEIGKQILDRNWDFVIFDECHSLGNPTSKRTKACLGSIYRKAKKVLFLSGSITRDNIPQLWPVWRTICPKQIPPYQQFIDKYVFYKKTRYGYKFLGGKDLKELGRIAKKHFLIRRTKAEVLKDLPDKLESKLVISAGKDDPKLLRFSVREAEEIIEAGGPLPEELSTLRRELGEAKVPVAIETILELLGMGSSLESCKKLVVFCYHHSVFSALERALAGYEIGYRSVSGKTSPAKREAAVSEFQESEAIQVFLGTYAAAEGITLTAANTCLVVEMSWSLAQNEQAPDRLHRIGQKHPVYIKYLLLENSLDDAVYRVYKRKYGDKKRIIKQ